MSVCPKYVDSYVFTHIAFILCRRFAISIRSISRADDELVLQQRSKVQNSDDGDALGQKEKVQDEEVLPPRSLQSLMVKSLPIKFLKGK